MKALTIAAVKQKHLTLNCKVLHVCVVVTSSFRPFSCCGPQKMSVLDGRLRPQGLINTLCPLTPTQCMIEMLSVNTKNTIITRYHVHSSC